MALVKRYLLRCDVCTRLSWPLWESEAGHSNSAATRARSKGSAAGWRRRHGQDLCPTCVEMEKRARLAAKVAAR